MYKNYDLELNILSCLLQRPELMKKSKLKDEYFLKYKKLWIFMKIFYEKFKMFDLVLMTSMCKNKNQMALFIETIIDAEPAPSLFEYYQEQLINLYEENKKEKWKIEKIYELANELYVRKINTNDFKDKFKKIEENAEKLFEKENKNNEEVE